MEPTDRRRIRVLALGLALDEPEAVLRERAAEALGVAREEIRALRVARRALDGRRRSAPRFVVHVDVALDPRRARSRRSTARSPPAARASCRRPRASSSTAFERGWREPRRRRRGRGTGRTVRRARARAARRARRPDRSRTRICASAAEPWRASCAAREVDPERNLLFGEGGAGTYSDGKLYTRTQHELEEPILAALVACGAPEAIA